MPVLQNVISRVLSKETERKFEGENSMIKTFFFTTTHSHFFVTAGFTRTSKKIKLLNHFLKNANSPIKQIVNILQTKLTVLVGGKKNYGRALAKSDNKTLKSAPHRLIFPRFSLNFYRFYGPADLKNQILNSTLAISKLVSCKKIMLFRKIAKEILNNEIVFPIFIKYVL